MCELRPSAATLLFSPRKLFSLQFNFKLISFSHFSFSHQLLFLSTSLFFPLSFHFLFIFPAMNHFVICWNVLLPKSFLLSLIVIRMNCCYQTCGRHKKKCWCENSTAWTVWQNISFWAALWQHEDFRLASHLTCPWVHACFALGSDQRHLHLENANQLQSEFDSQTRFQGNPITLRNFPRPFPCPSHAAAKTFSDAWLDLMR